MNRALPRGPVWRQLKSLLAAHDPARTPTEAGPQQIRIAAAVLLLEIERADRQVDPTERESIRRELTDKFSLSAEQCDAVVEAASERAKQSVSLHAYLQVLNDHLSHAQKLAVVEMLWHVAYADGVLEKHEEALLRELSDLLHVPHADFIRIKLAVAESRQSGNQ